MALYYVHIPDDERDLLVRALTPNEAVRAHLTYYELDPSEYEDEAFSVHRCDADLSVMGAIRWGEPDGMVPVDLKPLARWLA